jgi:hypothetical protein
MNSYENDNIISSKKSFEINLNVLQQLQLDDDTLLDYLNKLKSYRYVDEIDDLKYGAVIKWIPLTDPENIKLNHMGIICDIKITTNGTFIACKNFMHRHYTIKMDECFIFQKLSQQEEIIVSALDNFINL